MRKDTDKFVSKSSGLASWLDDFVSSLSKSNKKIASKEEVTADFEENQVETVEDDIITAEINVKDLQKVTWNDETFYVNFTDKGATVLNEFGNTVQNIENAKTLEEVDNFLNSQQIIAETDDEIKIEAEAEFEEEINSVVNGIDENEEVLASKEENSYEDGKVLEAIINGFEELEKRIDSLSKKVAIVEQTYARNPSFENEDNEIAEQEVKHFTENADKTSEQIKNEQNIDITTPQGRVELSKNKSLEDQIVDNEIENNSEQTIEQNDDDEDLCVEKLSGVEEKIFQNGICPKTGEQLVKSSKVVGDFLGIYSPIGKTEYAVNLNTGEIYFHKSK
jgi:hypothetical protein